MRAFRTLLAGALVFAVCVVAAEIGRRVLDGYRLTSVRLVRSPDHLDLTWSDGAATSVELPLRDISADPESKPEWFATRPADVRAPAPDWVAERRTAGGFEANYVWNAAALNEPTVLAYLNQQRGRLQDVFTFTPPDGQPHP